MTIREQLTALAEKRILVLDGAMGTMIQRFKLGESDFRGQRFAGHRQDLRGCNDLLCLTMPTVIGSIHEAYLRSGADIIETCSFNATSVSLDDYGLGDLAYEISRASALLARKAADKFSTPGKPRFVAGILGPTAKSAGLSPDMNDPGARAVHWDELEAAYYDNARGLLDGGADILMIETVFDTLNAKAAIFAVDRLLAERGADVPLMISATVSNAAGRLLAGQTVEAFCASVLHARPWSVGLNCSFGAEELRAHIRSLAAAAPCFVSAHPNAGLPNRFGEYDQDPVTMGKILEEYGREGLVNVVGGCCGSTPAHIAVIAARADFWTPRRPSSRRGTVLAGLEALPVNREQGLTYIGERTNVAGSRKFLRCIKEGDYDGAVSVARDMVEAGATVIDVCMDDALLDAETAMKEFLNRALSYPEVAKRPVMVDSSRWEVIEAGLKCLQGKGIVNSISLKEGEAEFLRRATLIRRYGAAVTVMLFDEQGQAADYERRIAIAKRAFDLLTGSGFPAEDIIFDPNVLTIATGIPEHGWYALDFLGACKWIHETYPEAQISGGISNLSFSFRGNEPVRQAMHAVFLKYAVDAGLSMAIVNPAVLVSFDGIERELRDAAKAVILCTEKDATERLLKAALAVKDRSGGGAADRPMPAVSRRDMDVRGRIIRGIVEGNDDYIEADVLELRPKCARALDVVEGPLMEGMREVGVRFGEGKMFLPQVIRSARVMKKAVAALEPFLEKEKIAVTGAGADAGERPAGGEKVLLATVRGDVHDIGKNIVGLVLGCNGYRILDLGVMVPSETILDTAEREEVDAIGLSGLITPSLDEMIRVAGEMEKRGLTIPLLVGGAAANLAHTALRIAPAYSGPVVYVSDAGSTASVVRSLFSPSGYRLFMDELRQRYREASERHETVVKRIDLIPVEEARRNPVPPDRNPPPDPKVTGIIELNDWPLERVIPRIDWKSFQEIWDSKNHDTFLEDARLLLDQVRAEGLLRLRGVAGIFPAASRGEDVLVYDTANPRTEAARFSFLRNQERKKNGGPNPCLADYLPREAAVKGPPGNGGWMGLFALSAGFGLEEAAARFKTRNDDYGFLLLGTLADVLAEAFAGEVHLRFQKEWWGYDPEIYRGIRPAFGYPACPDHEDKRTAFTLLEAERRSGLTLTESAMIVPAASVCGMFFVHSRAASFGAAPVGDDQLADWAERKGISPEEGLRRIGRI
jgi:5-methyltetrahydrofolate--homocysteine methyltransferase